MTNNEREGYILPILLDELIVDSEKQIDKLGFKRKEREIDPVGYYLTTVTDSIADKSDEINKAYRENNVTAAMVKIAVNEIVDKLGLNFTTPNYQERLRSEQSVWIYDNEYWQPISHTKYINFVKESCWRMGMSDDYVQDHLFISKAQQAIAFHCTNELVQKTPAGTVLINLKNGTMEIRENGEHQWRNHNIADNFKYILPYHYDKDAECPMFNKFLDEVLPEKESQMLLAEYIGYCLTKGIKAESMIILYGQGSNGKSVLLDITTKLFGEENVSHVTMSDITKEDKMRALINNKLINISSESSLDIDPSVLKAIVSGEPVTAYINYAGPFKMTEYAKLIASFNELPFPENTHGFHRRIKIIPFNVTITKDKKDVNLAKKIIANELPGIFNWALKGLDRFLTNKYEFTTSPACEEAMERYRLTSDSVKLFLNEQCKTDENIRTTGKYLFNKYKQFCTEDNMKPYGKQRFYDKLERLGHKRFKYQNADCFHIQYLCDE